MSKPLPGWARGILKATLPADWAEDILRDLEEEYLHIEVRSSPKAQLWLAGQVTAFTVHFLAAGLRHTVAKTALTDTGWMLDLKASVRSLRRAGLSTALVVLTAALAVGATTSVFSVVQGVLLQPLPYPAPEGLVRVWEVNEAWITSEVESYRSVAERLDPLAPSYRQWLEADTGLEAMGAYVDAAFYLTTPAGLQVLRGQEATSGFFETLKVQPVLGRPLRASDDLEGAPRVVVLSEQTWSEEFNSRTDALGRSLVINGQSHEVIGVMPAGFGSQLSGSLESTLPAGPVRLWTPLFREAYRGYESTPVIARLGSDDLPTASQRLAGVHRTLLANQARELAGDAEPLSRMQHSVRLVGLRDSVVGDVRSTLLFLIAAVILVLIVTTVNIANVLTAKSLERSKQTALQAALGATRARLVRLQLTESAVLAGTGGILGVATAMVLLPLIVRLLPPGVPRTSEVRLDVTVLACGLLVTLVSTCAAGALPALFSTSVDPQSALAAHSRSSTNSKAASRLRSGLLVVEIAIAFVMLFAAGLLARSFHELWSQERGFRTSGLVALRIDPDLSDAGRNTDYRTFVHTLHQRLNAMPGINVTAANNLPLSGSSSGSRVAIERPGQEPEDGRALLSVGLLGYLDTMGIPLVAGRDFNTSDTTNGTRVAMVNQVMATKYWNEGALGQRLQVDGPNWIEVVGVVSDVKHQSLAAAADSKIYLPASQSNRDTNEWIFRIEGSLVGAVKAARTEIASFSPTTPVVREIVLDQKISDSVAIPRFRTQLVLSLAILAAILALAGVYGVLAFSVAQRTKEIGVRMALGAATTRVVREVLTGGLSLALWGIGAGVGVVWLSFESLQPFLYGVPARHVPTMLMVAAGLLLVSLLGAAVPARRAASVDPLAALKAE